MLEAARAQGGLSLFAINMKSFSVHRLRNHRSSPGRWWTGCGQNNHTRPKLSPLGETRIKGVVSPEEAERVRFCRTCERLAKRGIQTEHERMGPHA